LNLDDDLHDLTFQGAFNGDISNVWRQRLANAQIFNPTHTTCPDYSQPDSDGVFGMTEMLEGGGG